MRFLDTNVLIYAVSAAAEDATKRHRALELLAGRNLALSVQVLQRFPVQANTLDVMWAAFIIRARFGLSYWDSNIIAAAHLCGCRIVYSEDLSTEQDYSGLRVINPFAHLRT